MNHFVSSSHKWRIDIKGNDFEVKEMWALAIEVESSVGNKFDWLAVAARRWRNIASRPAISHAQLPRWWKIKRLTGVCSSWTENTETVCWCARRYLAWMLISASIYDTRKYSLACLWIARKGEAIILHTNVPPYLHRPCWKYRQTGMSFYYIAQYYSETGCCCAVKKLRLVCCLPQVVSGALIGWFAPITT